LLKFDYQVERNSRSVWKVTVQEKSYADTGSNGTTRRMRTRIRLKSQNFHKDSTSRLEAKGGPSY